MEVISPCVRLVVYAIVSRTTTCLSELFIMTPELFYASTTSNAMYELEGIQQAAD